MLETQIEKLTERVAAVETKQDQTNKLLADILVTIRGDHTTPPEPPKPIEATKEEVTSGKGSEEKTENLSKSAPEEAPAYTLNDVREAYLSVQQEFGKEAAIGVIKDIAGEVKNITRVPEHKFAEIIAAFQAYGEKEAA